MAQQQKSSGAVCQQKKTRDLEVPRNEKEVIEMYIKGGNERKNGT